MITKELILEAAGLLTEALSAKDKKVIDAFADKKSLDGKTLFSNGSKLEDAIKVIATWKNDKIVIADISSRENQTTVNYLKKNTPTNWFAESLTESKKVNSPLSPDYIEADTMTSWNGDPDVLAKQWNAFVDALSLHFDKAGRNSYKNAEKKAWTALKNDTKFASYAPSKLKSIAATYA